MFNLSSDRRLDAPSQPFLASQNGTILTEMGSDRRSADLLNFSPVTSASSLIFIDGGITDYQALSTNIKSGAQIIFLDASQDGLSQIGAELAKHTNISSVHILSHGGAGSLQLGNALVDFQTLSDRSNELRHWADALTLDADILLYGCDVAINFAGQRFVQQLSTLTGADVAASTDLTGNAARGGNWTLEFATGAIEASLPFQFEALSAYDGVLASFNFTNFASITGLRLNGNAAQATNTLRLTPATANQAGSAFFTTAIAVNADTSFQTSFQFRLNGGQGTGGADGFVFMLQNSTAGVTALGSPGGSLGYDIRDYGTGSQIGRSLAIEFDSSKNSWDLDGNHISVLRDGNVGTPLATIATSVDLNNGSLRNAWVDYDGTTNLLKVFLSTTTTKPTTATLSTTVDLAAIVGTSAFVGFSAGTGELVNAQAITSWAFNSTDPPPADTTPPTATVAAAALSTAGTTPYTFTVTYADNVAVNRSTLDANDIRVTGPGGFSQLATLSSVNLPGNGTPLIATYSITAPGGSWDPADNGTYSIALLAAQVTDTSSNAAAAATLGTFAVNVPPATGSGNGLLGEYFDNIDFIAPVLLRTDATVNFNWGNGSPDPLIGADTFSVRWSGEVLPLYSETYTFFTNTDDGVQLSINGQLIINQLIDQAPTEVRGTITLQAGQRYTLRMEYYENGGGAQAQLGWFSTSQAREIIPQSQLFSGTTPPPPPPAPGLGNGLRGDYYDNLDFTGYRLSRTDATINYDWGTGSPDAAIGADTFSVRWTGQVEAQFSETYTFFTTTDDGVRLWVNGQQLINQFQDQAATVAQGSITLQAGQRYDIRMEYYDNGGGALARLGWFSSSQVRQIIPQAQLFSSIGTIGVAQDTITVNEAAGTATVTVARTGGSNGRAAVDFTTNNGAAIAGSDYTTTLGTLVFETGETSKTVLVPILNDGIAESTETFGFGLGRTEGANLGVARTATITILDDDTASTLSLSQPVFNVTEDGGNVTITVQRNGNTTGTAAIDFSTSNGSATAGLDYTAVSQRLNFTAGQIAQTVTIPILNDTLVETNETFTVTLSNPAGGSLGSQTTATVNIIDNDLSAFTRQTVVSGLDRPTTLDWSPDGRYMFVAQQNGIVRIVDNGTLLPTPFLDISARVNGVRDRGLLGFAVHPNLYTGSPYVYLLYTYDPPEVNGTGLAGADREGNRPARLGRFTVNTATMTVDPNSEVVILGKNSTWAYTSRPDGNSTSDLTIVPSGIANGTTIIAPANQIDVGTQDNDPITPGIQNQNIRDYIAADSESHSIGQVVFGVDGALYVSIGDGASYNFMDPRAVRVQDIDNLSGKVLRIDPITGEGLATNPFYNGDANSNRSKVFYLGVRNSFRMAIDPVSQLPITGDVGWYTWEELNTGPAGSNFGWPYFEGGNGTSNRAPGYEDLASAPAFYSSGIPVVAPLLGRSHEVDGARAIMAGDFLSSNILIFGDINQGQLFAATLNASRQVTNVQVFDSTAGPIVDAEVGPDSRLYGVDLFNGTIVRWTQA